MGRVTLLGADEIDQRIRASNKVGGTIAMLQINETPVVGAVRGSEMHIARSDAPEDRATASSLQGRFIITIPVDHVYVGERLRRVCAVIRRRFSVGASPTRQPLQPEATGAVMEATK